MADTALKPAEPGIGSDAVEASPEIRTSRGQVILVDAADHAELSRYTWRVLSNGYAARHGPRIAGKSTDVLMHRQLLGLLPSDRKFGDHVNCCRLDNRRANLRVANPVENARNQLVHCDSASGIKGVRAFRGKWQARIYHNGHETHLGTFDTAEDATEFRQLAAEMLHGEFVNHGGDRAA